MITVPNIQITKRWTLQTVVWMCKPTFKIWTWPRPNSYARKTVGRPLFYGLYLGVIEWRWFDQTWGNRG